MNYCAMERKMRQFALFEMIVIVYCLIGCYGDRLCGPVRNFKNVVSITNTSELSLVDRLFDQHNCSRSDELQRLAYNMHI